MWWVLWTQRDWILIWITKVEKKAELKETIMPSITGVATALNAIKIAVEMGKKLISADEIFKNAELKLQLVDMISALYDVKISLIEAEESAREKDVEIIRLQEALDIKPNMERFENAYYKKNEEGILVGEAYCSSCWESKYKLIHLTRGHSVGKPRECPICKNIFHGYYTPEELRKMTDTKK